MIAASSLCFLRPLIEIASRLLKKLLTVVVYNSAGYELYCAYHSSRTFRTRSNVQMLVKAQRLIIFELSDSEEIPDQVKR